MERGAKVAKDSFLPASPFLRPLRRLGGAEEMLRRGKACMCKVPVQIP